MENSTLRAFMLLYIFLAGTGIYSIVLSLYKLTNPHKVVDPNSTIQTKLFKLSGPIGFVYGVFVIILVIILVRTDNSNKLTNILRQAEAHNAILERENIYLKSIVGDSTSTEPSYFKITVSAYNPSSILGGKVLIQWEANSIQFKGIKGASIEERGVYEKFNFQISVGDKFFIKLFSETIYGVNVLNDLGGLTLEFYKTQ